MTSPVDPTSTSVPSAPATVDGLADQIRQLAAQINQPPYNFDPTTIRKATVTAVDAGSSGTAPTCTVLFSGDTTSPVSGVRFAAIYGPQVGDTVIVLKQASDFFLLTDIASAGNQQASSPVGGWTQATLASGHTHGGNSNGNLMYRRVMDNGAWKMQWKGAVNYNGANTTILAANLSGDFTPAAKVSMVAAREVASGGGTAIGVDFTTSGNISIAGPTWATSSEGGESTSGASPGGTTDSVDPIDSTTSDQAGTVAGSTHSHGVVGSHSHNISVDNHWHGNGTHAHTASNPGWISFNGLEYFLG